MLRNAAGIVIYRVVDNIPEVLLLYNGRWSPPKGGVDAGESFIVAAKRETLEESGLQDDDYNLITPYQFSIQFTHGDKSKQIMMFLAEVKDPNHIITISSEHSKFKWMRLEEALVSRNHAPSNEQFSSLYQDAFKHIHQSNQSHFLQYNTREHP